MKEIKLTQGKVALVDDDMFEELNQWKWYAHKSRNTYYAERMSSTIKGKRYPIKMHHEIIGKPLKEFIADHRNGNGLHNYKSNLRFVTNRQNCQNRKNIMKSSKYPGVYWQKQTEKWQARIRINGKRQYLGLFISELKAFTIYKQAVEGLGEKIVDI